MRTRKFCLGILLAVLLCLSGCAKRDGAIAKEVASLDATFRAYGLQLDDYEIIKRQTNSDEKTDYVWITLEGSNDDFDYFASYEITYIKYNDGWHLENGERESATYHAKCEPDTIEIQQELAEQYSNLQFAKAENNLSDNRSVQYFSGTVTNKYKISTYDIKLEYAFTPENGWRIVNQTDSLKKVDYDIQGEWLYQDDNHIYYMCISDVSGDKATIQYAFLNKELPTNDEYWTLRSADSKVYTIQPFAEHIGDTYTSNYIFFDVGWKNTYKTLRSDDKGYIWLHENSDEFCVNNFWLKRISESTNAENYPEELKHIVETYVEDYTLIPDGLFDEKLVEYFSYFKKTYQQLGLNPNKASNIMDTRYPLEKAMFLGREAYVYLWVQPEETAIPTDIQIAVPDMSFDEVKEYLSDNLKLKIYEDEDWHFVVVVPNTDLTISVSKETLGCRIFVNPVT